MNGSEIFKINSTSEFDVQALKVYRHQYRHNAVYKEFCSYLRKTEQNVTQVSEIPFLPISFFKSKEIISGERNPVTIFTSSGTTGSETSKHFVNRTGLYEQSFREAFEHFYGKIEDYCVLALLPSYLEREGSSLIYMVDDMIKQSKHVDSGFYLNDLDSLRKKLTQLDASGQKILLIGVSFALLDMAETHPLQLKNTIVMETGGMKGRRKELIREDLHDILKEGFGVPVIHSEYGMTELLSQGYSKGNGIFKTPPWMKILIRDTEDPLAYQDHKKTGGINVIDLANIDSCSFIATQDLGKTYANNTFEVLGRFDHSDVRGCNLMVL
ncbi:acyl transferase [Zobellia nedashkovskayae]|uniref:LuxE/PaaK family acyltransferase n=1 Tax=Zobellia nedashkovskayae TaxID=2779510 RepID=UPI00188B99DE|nr:acyl transferase [Zobellia nedashkovskayae]